MEPFTPIDENIEELFDPEPQQQKPNPDFINNNIDGLPPKLQNDIPPEPTPPPSMQQIQQPILSSNNLNNNQPEQPPISEPSEPSKPSEPSEPSQPIQEPPSDPSPNPDPIPNGNPNPTQSTAPQSQPQTQTQTQPQSIPAPQEQKNEFIDLKEYEEDTNDIDTQRQELKKLDLPIVDSLQPDELVLSINDTINKMSKLDPKKQSLVIMAYKNNLIQQLERLQNISKAIDSLNDMQKTAESLPKNSKTGYPDIESINLALREHCFFAEQVNLFGMLLIEVCDFKKLREEFGSEYTDIFMKELANTIKKEFIYQHLLFHYSQNRFVVLVYIENEQELMVCGKEVIRILTTHAYDIKEESLHSSISVGAAIFEKNQNKRSDNDDNKDEKEDDSPQQQFDFRTWMKNCELGLNKANNSGLKNQCCITKESDTIRAIMPSMAANDSGSNHAHKKSTLSLLARTRGHSSGGSSYGKLKLAEMQNNLSPQQIRASIRLYDKLNRIKIKEDEEKNGKLDKTKNGYLTRDNYKLVALSLCRRLNEQGANYNFQHPKHNGNTVLMLCCIKNFDIIIKYFCLKLHEEVDFNLVNNDGNNALMLAILNKDINDEYVKMIIERTTDKMSMNHEGKTAKQLAEQMGRNELVPLLNTI